MTPSCSSSRCFTGGRICRPWRQPFGSSWKRSSRQSPLEARQAVLRVVRREAERLRRDVLVEDRGLVVPAMARAA